MSAVQRKTVLPILAILILLGLFVYHILGEARQRALGYAAWWGNTPAVTRLLALGVDPNTRGHNGKTALEDAMMSGRFETVQPFLEKGADIKKISPFLLLQHAVESDDQRLLEVLIKRGVNVNTLPSQLGMTPLVVSAASLGKWKMLDLLLEAGIDVKGQAGADALSYLLLHWEEEPGPLNAVQKLLDKGADPNGIASSQYSVLDSAVQSGHTKAVKILLAHGANPNKKSPNGFSPLSLTQSGSEIAHLLKAAGAKP